MPEVESKLTAALKLAHAKGYRVKDGKVFNSKGKQRVVAVSPSGYKRFNVSVGPETCPVYVHRLVAFQKFGDVIFDSGTQVRHLDGDSLNNNDMNIVIGTQSDNMMDRPRHVRMKLAINAARSENGPYLGDDFWSKIDKDREAGMGYRKLEKKYGVNRSTLSYRYGKRKKRATSLVPPERSHCSQAVPA